MFVLLLYLSKESPTQLVQLVWIPIVTFTIYFAFWLFLSLICLMIFNPFYLMLYNSKLVKNNDISCKMYWYRKSQCSHCNSRCMSDDAPLVALAAYDYIKQRLYDPSNEFIYYRSAEERKGLLCHWVCSLVLAELHCHCKG